MQSDAKRDDLDAITAEEVAKLPSLARHLPRILMPLSFQIDSYSQPVEINRNRRLMDFFAFVKRTYPDEPYTEIQREQLSQQKLDQAHKMALISLEQKYLDFPFWVHSKFNIALRLGLDKLNGESILDIGAGPGHFGVVASYMGCDYDGLEAVLYELTPRDCHVFDQLCTFFGIRRITHTIQPFKTLKLEKRYRLVTVLMGNFCSYKTSSGPRTPWSWPEWAFLLDNLASDLLTPEFGMYFHISRDYLPPDVVENIRKFATTFDEGSSVFTFDQSLDLDALRRSVPKDPSAV